MPRVLQLNRIGQMPWNSIFSALILASLMYISLLACCMYITVYFELDFVPFLHLLNTNENTILRSIILLQIFFKGFPFTTGIICVTVLLLFAGRERENVNCYGSILQRLLFFPRINIYKQIKLIVHFELITIKSSWTFAIKIFLTHNFTLPCILTIIQSSII